MKTKTNRILAFGCILAVVAGGTAYAAAGTTMPAVHHQVTATDTSTTPDNAVDPSLAPETSTVGGGAPDSGSSVQNGVQCNMLLGIRPARHASGDIQEVTLQVPATEVGDGATRDVYFPIIDSPEKALRIGGDMTTVGICATPAGQMINYRIAFRSGGVATVFLPKISPDADGINLLLVDGKHVFHSAVYTGQSKITFSQ